jgi:uncharacterized protein (DUF58 family)
MKPYRLPLTPKTRQIYILPTRAGLFMGGILLVSLLASLNDTNNLGLLLTFFLFSMALSSIVLTQKNLKGLHLKTLFCPPVFAGEPPCLHLELMSPERERAGLMLITASHRSPIKRIGKDEKGTLILPLPPQKRGIFRLPKLALESHAPLGLFYAWVPLAPEVEIVVYPKPLPGPLPRNQGTGKGDGATGEKPDKDGSEDFTGHKSYAPGDPLSRIDWKILSRNRGMHIKTFEAPAQMPVFDFNDFPGMDTEERLSRLCHGILLASSRKKTFGLRLPGKDVPAENSTAHKDRCLFLLAGHTAEDSMKKSFPALLETMGKKDHVLVIQ